jgi:hypothetical protein
MREDLSSNRMRGRSNLLLDLDARVFDVLGLLLDLDARVGDVLGLLLDLDLSLDRDLDGADADTGRANALLAPASPPPVLADAPAPALLAPASPPPVLADA